MSAETDPAITDKKQRNSEPTLIGDLDSGTDILSNLIRKHHLDLAGCRFRLLCTNKEIKSGGRSRPGKVSKATPLIKHLASDDQGNEPDFIILVSLTQWNDADLSKRTAILDHLLTCIEAKEDEKSGEMKFTIVGPQVAEFAEIVERHGTYNEALKDIAHVITHASGVNPITR